MIKLDAVINDKKLLASIQKGVSQFNRSTSGRSKLNLKINEKGFRQPLGRITGDLDKFESALAASNARVIAFGASTAVIGGITKAFKELAMTTIKVQKAFIDINRILSVSNAQFDKFSTELFNIGKKTATTFEDSSKAALEFARQGLGLNETLKRTADALTLVRLTGVNADKAVSSLTAAVNAFQHTSISTTEVLNKFVAVETKFAVSAKDLMEGLGRVGSAAVDAKVSFNELNAMIAAVQQQTGRGGAVIGNAMKTIFTRLQRSETLEALEAYGVAVRDVEGSTRPAMDILHDFAKTYKTLSDANRAYLREQVAGVFQANILSAVVKDLNSNMQVYGRALVTSKGATNQAAMANAKLNQSISALISQTGTELVRLQENIGKVTFEPIAKAILGPFKGILESINNVIDGEGLGSDVANGILKGLRNILAGPGLVSAIAVIGITFVKTLSYITKALPTLVGITSETQKRANIEASIVAMMAQDASLAKQISAAEGNAAVQAGIFLGAAQKLAAAFKKQEVSTAAIVRNLSMAGMTTNKMGAMVPAKGGRRGAAGYIPGVAGEMHDIRRGVGGVSSSARPVHIPNFAFGGGQHGSMIANTGEHIVPNFSGGGSAIFNPAMVRANGGLPQGAKRITAAQGYVPNFAMMRPIDYFAQSSATAGGYYRGIKSGKINASVLNTGFKSRSADDMNALRATALLQRNKATGAAKTKNLYSISARDVGIGAIVGMKTRKGPYSPRQSFATILGREGAVKQDPLLREYMMANKHKSVEITNIPVGGLSTLGTGRDDADQRLKQAFTKKLNKFMLPALNKYSGNIFKSLLKDDGLNFIKSLQDNRQRVFSTSVEGGIFESALQLASRNSKNFSGDDIARFDFEEGGRISPMLRKTFFSKTPGVRRADAKRSDSSPNILTLIGKSFGTAATSKVIASHPALRADIAAWKKTQPASKGKSPRGAGGYVPNFARGGSLGEAIKREKAAGIPSSAIRINSSPRFQSPLNPAGLAVTNQIDEPRGLRDVPNFAATPTVNLASIFGPKKGMINTQAAFASLSAAGQKLAVALAKETMTVEQVERVLKTLQGKYKFNEAVMTQFSSNIQSTSTKIKDAGNKAAAAPVAKGGGAGVGVGLGLMMLAPMVGGAAEQAVGGPLGGAFSGALTGAAMGGMMGSMVSPGVGSVVGAVGGGVIGGVAGFAGGIETATEALTNFTTTMQNNLTGAQAYMVAQKKVVASVDDADFEKAASAASDALYSIDDPVLRRKIQEAGNEFGKLTDVIRDYRHEQEKDLKIKRTLAAAEAAVNTNFTEKGIFIEEGADPREVERRRKAEAKKFLTPLASYLIGEGKAQGKTLQETVAQAKMIQDAISAAWTQPATGEKLWEGKVNEAKMREGLKDAGMESSAAEQISEFLGSKMDKFLKSYFSLDTAMGSENDMQVMFAEFLATTVEDVGAEMNKAAQQALTNRKNLANFTKSLSLMYKQIDDAIVGRADIARRMGTNLARRTQRLGARGSMLSKAMDPMDLARERRDEGMANIEAKRGLLSGGVITSFGPKLGSLLEKIAANAQEELEDFGESIMAPFMKGNFADAMKALDEQRGRKITADGVEAPRLNTKQMKAVVDFNRDLREGIAKGDEGIRKQELLLKDKFREDQVRAEILKAERDIQLQKTDYINKLELALATEEAVVSGRLNTLSLIESDPRVTRFKGPVAKQKFAGDIATEKLAIQQGLATDKLELEIETERAAIIAQHLLNASTQKLTESNFSLMDVLRLHLTALDKPEAMEDQVKRFAEVVASQTAETKSVLAEVRKFTGTITPKGTPVVIVQDPSTAAGEGGGVDPSLWKANLATPRVQYEVQRNIAVQAARDKMTERQDKRRWITGRAEKNISAAGQKAMREFPTFDQWKEIQKRAPLTAAGSTLPSGTVMPKRRVRSRATEDLTGVSSGGTAAGEKNPYLTISERNAFNLTNEPPPKSNAQLLKESSDRVLQKVEDQKQAKAAASAKRVEQDFPPEILAKFKEAQARGESPDWLSFVAKERGKTGAKPEITGKRMPDAELLKTIRKLKAREADEKRITGSVAGKRGTIKPAGRKAAAQALQEAKADIIALRKKIKEGTDEVVLAEGVAGKGQGAPAIQQAAQTVKVEEEVVGHKETQYELAKILAAQTSKERIDLINTALQEGKITEEMHFQLMTAEKIAEKRRGILGTSQAQEKANLDAQNRFNSGLVESQTKFTEGLKDGLGVVYTDSEGLMNRLGKSLPLTFRDNMVSAMEDVMDKTQDFDDALRGVAISFLKEMRRAFLQQGVSSLMNAVTAATVQGAATQMRPKYFQSQSGSRVPGSGTGDIVPAMLEPGEYVVNRKAAENNMPLLNSLNFGAYPRFGAQEGGLTPNQFRYTDRASELFSSPANVWDLGLGFTVPRSGRKSKPKKDIKRAFKSGKISSRQAFQFKKGFGLLDGWWITGKAGADISFPRSSAQGNLPRDAKKAFAKGIINSQEYRTIRQIHGFQSGGAATLDAQLGSTLAGHRKKGGPDASGFLWMNSNPQMEENAQDVSEAVQKRLQKAQEKENLKKQFLGMLISAGIGQAMGKIGDFIGSKTAMGVNMNELSQAQKLELYGGLDEDAFAQKHGFGSMKAMMDPKYGGGKFKTGRWSKLGKAIREQRGESLKGKDFDFQRGGSVSAQRFQTGGAVGRYGVRGFQGGGSVSVNPLSSSSNVNNINISVNTGGNSSGNTEGNTRSVVGTSDEGTQAKELSEKIKARVIAVISEEQRVGGLLSPTRRKP